MKGLLDFDLNEAMKKVSTPEGALAIGLLSRPNQRLGKAIGGAMGDVYAQQQAMTQAQMQAMQMKQLQQEFAARQAEEERRKAQEAKMQQQFPQLAGLPQHMQNAIMQQRAAEAKANQPLSLSPGSVYFDPVTQQPIFTAPTKTPGAGLQLRVGPNGEIEFGTNGVPGLPFGKKGQNELEGKTINAVDALANLRRIAGTYQPGYLTYYGKGKAAALNFADKAGVDISKNSAAFIGGAEQFKNSVDQFFNAYRKEITGAAASNQELERLKKTMINSDMGPTQFRYSFDQITKAMQQNLIMYTQLRAQGLTGDRLVEAMNDNYYTLDEKLNVVPVKDLGVGGGSEAAPNPAKASTLEQAKMIREQRRKAAAAANTGGAF